MHRRIFRLSLWVSLGSSVACAGGPKETNTESNGDATQGESTGIGQMSADGSGRTDESGTASESTAADTQGADTSSAHTDSQGTDTLGTGSGDTSGSQGSGSAETSASGESGDTEGIGEPPEQPPGVSAGFCEDVGSEAWCYSGAGATYNVGICHPGRQQCVQIDLDLGQWGPCEDEQVPQVEICDGLDNDCDGQTDEDLGSTTCGEGVCNHEEPNCVDGRPSECDPFEGSSMEICDGLDNDCDGDIDDGLGDESVECGVGQCAHTVTACEGGELPECDPLEGATEEVCDGVDNDCNGDTDEGLDDLACGVGQCAHTVPACINGIPQICDPFDGATDETCDTIDNDCDGLTDEDQGNWVCGNLDCQVVVPTCVDGVEQPPESCVPLPGGEEICGDGVDNNCDGEAPACIETFVAGIDNAIRPIDIIWAIDSSGSMAEEMATVEAEINDFATVLADSGSSARLHLIADRGTESFEICVAPPLGGVNCTDNAPQFYQYDTNGGTNGQPMVHSSNALGRIMQQSPTWIPRLQTNSFLTFIVTTDDDGDDGAWVAPEDDSSTDDCGNSYLADGSFGNSCRWDDPSSTNNYTSLVEDWGAFLGFRSYMTNFFASRTMIDDWNFYSIIGDTGTAVLSGADDAYEFSCLTSVETGDEYVKLSVLTETQDDMTAICAADWDLTGLAEDIVSNVPNDTYILDGSPPGNCLAVDPATIVVLIDGFPLMPADWSYDAPSCTVTIINNIPEVNSNVSIVYESF